AEDNEYNGCHIPKGGIVLSDIRFKFTKSDVSVPHRYFNSDGSWVTDVLDPANFALGFGRRSCPARHFVIASLCDHVALTLHVFNVRPKRDSDGKPGTIKLNPVSAVISYASFQRSINHIENDELALLPAGTQQSFETT
ncbi:hypothetical protein K466DRAFT_486090, partial [Polyporus arcularius HHB13444]